MERGREQDRMSEEAPDYQQRQDYPSGPEERRGEGEPTEYRDRREYYYHPRTRKGGGLEHISKKTVMIILVIGILLIAVGAIWISSAKVPSYKKYYDDDIEDRNDYREDWTKGLFTATKVGSVLALLGCLINSIVSISVGVVSEELEKEEKFGLLIVGSLFAIGMILVMNHFFTYVI